METNKKEKIYKVIMLIIITATVTFMVTSIGMYNHFTRTGVGAETLLNNIEASGKELDINSKFSIVNDFIEKYYIGDIDQKQMIETALQGYVAGLDDKYTEYLPKSDYGELLIDIKGDYSGIGIYIVQDIEGKITIVMPMKNSPAEAAGLEPGDEILSVNGQSCEGLDLVTVSNKIKGEEGTTVELELRRGEETIKKKLKEKLLKYKIVEAKY